MKKVLSLLLVLVLALGMSTMALAKGDYTIDGSLPDIDVGDWEPQTGNDLPSKPNAATKAITVDEEDDAEELAIGDASGLPVGVSFTSAMWTEDNEMFIPLDDAVSVPGQAWLSVSDMRKGKLSYKASMRSGSKVFESLSLVDKDITYTGTSNPTLVAKKVACIKIVMADPFVSVDEVDFEIKIIPYDDGKRLSEYESTVSGTYMNEVEEVDETWDWVDISNGTVIDTLEYNKLVEAELGNGVSVWTKLFKDKKYYGIATRDDDEKDDVVYEKYPDIDSIITVKSIGLSSTAQYVTFTDYDDTFFVYGADWKYLGKSNEKVAFSSKYYLAHKELDVDEEDLEEPDDEDLEDLDVPEPGPGTGGDGYTENVNDNPGTGK